MTLAVKNGPVDFVDLMNLEKITDNTFRSTTRAYAPDTNRAYGGHVYAQAVWAAAQTVKPGFLVHTVTGFFTLQGLSDVPFVYHVKTVRNGRSFCVRIVDVIQIEGKGTCFTCTCSFKLPDQDLLHAQGEHDINEKYKSVLRGRGPEEFGAPFRFRDPRKIANEQKDSIRPLFPGLDTRMIEMGEYNRNRTAWDRRQLFYSTIIGSIPPVSEASNLHACAHLYASDVMSLFVIVGLLELDAYVVSMASLSHTVIFHTAAEPLSVYDESGNKRYFCQEVWTDRAEDGRGVHHSRIWGPDGRHVATSIQDGLVRLKATPEEVKALRERLEPKRRSKL